MDVSGLPGGEGKKQFHGTGQGSHRGCLRRNRVPLIVISSLCVFGLISTSSWITENTTWKLPYLNMWGSGMSFNKRGCPLQRSDPFAPRMMAVINMTIFRSNHSCAGDPALGIFKGVAFHLERGHLLVRDVKFPDDVKCCLQVVTRKDDESVRIHECKGLSNEVNQTTAIESPTEVILVTCKNSKGENYYTDGFQIIQEKAKVETRIRTWQEEQLKSEVKVNHDGRLSVILFGIDTLSQMHFERSMPLTKLYLDNDLKAVKLKGYNKVQENTFRNVIAFLNLLTDEEFSRRCLTYRKKWKIRKDCPFIWNTFASHGYRTAYFDDETKNSIFNLHYLNAFKDYPNGPTDYYGRPYALLMGRRQNFSKFCYGPRLSFQHLLDNVKTMAHVFNSSDRPYFNLIWSVKLSHDSLDTLPWGDKPLLETLKYLHGNGHFNHTAFFLLADHGFRWHEDIYESMIENRMPVAYIVLPPWFSQRYPNASENLQWNGENSVASPFDMHKTLLDMLDLNRFDTWRTNRYFQPKRPVMAKRGQSLFELNPRGRNCESAGIPPMWCLCYQMVIPLRNDAFLAVSAAEAVMEEVNRKVQKIDSHKCETLRLAEIVNATVILFNEETWTKPECRRLISNATSQSKSSSSCDDKIYISVRIRGSPHDPVFHTMMLRNETGAVLAPSEIVREDWYSIKGHCVHNNVRPYCICKDFQ